MTFRFQRAFFTSVLCALVASACGSASDGNCPYGECGLRDGATAGSGGAAGTGGGSPGTGGIGGGSAGAAGGSAGGSIGGSAGVGGGGGGGGAGGSAGAGGSGGSTGGSSGAGGSPNTRACGGRLGNTCGSSEYCGYQAPSDCGRADGTAYCVPKLDGGCSTNYEPVCGCDGKTYGNACEARRAGVGLSDKGACAQAPQTCGGIAAIACPAGQYCSYDAGTCQKPDATGVCRTAPRDAACTADYAPVCGCNNKTYSNACQAQLAGVSVLSKGQCEPACDANKVDGGCASRTCGGIAGLKCAAGESCLFETGQCRVADAAGTCVDTRGGACTDIYAPVCGCDSKTYGNACSARSSGVSVLHEGACGSVCQVGTATYPDGTGGIPSTDGCNTCSCNAGQLACTKRACVSTSCVVDSQVSADGATNVPDPSSCNTCTCMAGSIGNCTDMACPTSGKGCQVGRAYYRNGSESVTTDGTVKCVCTDGAFLCNAIK